MQSSHVFLHILHKVSVSVENNGTPLSHFLQKELASSLVETPQTSPDITVSFRPESISPSSYSVKDSVSYDSKGPFLFDKNFRLCRIDLAQIGNKNLSVVCDPEFNPHFFAIILEALVQVYLFSFESFFCHASAFEYEGKVILCPAWRNSGKTDLMLSFMSEGARYIADDWVVINKQGEIEGYPKRINLFPYNFHHFPQLLSKVEEGMRLFADRSFLNSESDRRARISPEQLFPDAIVDSPRKVDYTVYLKKGLPKETQGIQPLSRETLAEVIYESALFEQNFFYTLYLLYQAEKGYEVPALEKMGVELPILIQQTVDKLGKTQTLVQNEKPSFQDTSQHIKNLLHSEAVPL